VQKDAANHQGEAVADAAEVVSIEKGYNDKPYFRRALKMATRYGSHP
jgi:hypothetical protein